MLICPWLLHNVKVVTICLTVQLVVQLNQVVSCRCKGLNLEQFSGFVNSVMNLVFVCKNNFSAWGGTCMIDTHYGMGI